ncbi:BrnT family toxin [Martelella limonii]|uniref:BrnT family toxin n=1 Tax=Martelella limonii TaxID=1647649 RepID=UPI0015809899|nr:BrnT family toxin [Martelella limonii]
MEFEWDELKRLRVLDEHGVDLLYAALIFEGAVLTRVDDRRDYGERREISLGMVEGECFVDVHTERDGICRLITAWKGGRNERTIYETSLARGVAGEEGPG